MTTIINDQRRLARQRYLTGIPRTIPNMPTVNGFPLPEALRSQHVDIRLEALELQRQLIAASSAETPEAARMAVRPIRRRVMLQEGMHYERDTGVEYDSNFQEGYIRWVEEGSGMSVSSHFLHSTAGRWLRGTGVPADKFQLFVNMGMYEHEDVVTLALDVRRFQHLREDLHVGSELSPEEFETLCTYLKVYAHYVDGTASAHHYRVGAARFAIKLSDVRERAAPTDGNAETETTLREDVFSAHILEMMVALSTPTMTNTNDKRKFNKQPSSKGRRRNDRANDPNTSPVLSAAVWHGKEMLHYSKDSSLDGLDSKSWPYLIEKCADFWAQERAAGNLIDAPQLCTQCDSSVVVTLKVNGKNPRPPTKPDTPKDSSHCWFKPDMTNTACFRCRLTNCACTLKSSWKWGKYHVRPFFNGEQQGGMVVDGEEEDEMELENDEFVDNDE
ncbi:hypothetical protein BDZ89DRAFT_1052955 [Hymenopellis radicata]|nr:hypothetical protein BDZ89DRAFT_1052955 [Hymenopellis radicata]